MTDTVNCLPIVSIIAGKISYVYSGLPLAFRIWTTSDGLPVLQMFQVMALNDLLPNQGTKLRIVWEICWNWFPGYTTEYFLNLWGAFYLIGTF